MRISIRSSKFHNFIVLSELQDAKIKPSGLKQRDFTYQAWPSSVKISSEVSVLHSLMVLSKLQEAIVVPSWL